MTIIEPNIKQYFLPFVLNKDIAINNSLLQDGKDAGNQYQLFSFRNPVSGSFAQMQAKGRINLFPTAVENQVNRQLKFNADVSNKLLYAKSTTNNDSATSRSSITFNSLMNALPAVQIREFQPDSKLDNMINFFGSMWKAITAASQTDPEKAKNDSNFLDKLTMLFKPQFYEKIGHLGKFMYNYLGQSDFYMFEYGGKSIPNNMFSDKAANGLVSKICEFPFLIYYKLQSSLTTNIYEIPAMLTDKTMYSSDGYKGWTSGNTNNVSLTNMPGMDLINKIPLVGNMISKSLDNISINYTPGWAAKEGGAVSDPEVSIQFDLFNDSYEAAMINFIFVNTIIPNNRFLQYGLLQHSPSLYDIKIEGFNRLYMCAGKFQVQQEGVMRTPSPKFIHELCTKYFTNSSKAIQLENAMLNEGILKIPDVYRVQMKFQSLLPQNFNTYIYTYIANESIDQSVTDSVYTDSSFGDIIPSFDKKIAKAATTYWDNYGDAETSWGNAMLNVIEQKTLNALKESK